MENSNDTIGDLTRDLPACSAVPQPTALPRAPSDKVVGSGNNELAGMCKEEVDTTVVLLFRQLARWSKINGNASTRIVFVSFEI